MFITFEGGEGAGKSTVMALVGERLKQLQQNVLLTREPGGVPLAEHLRTVILDNDMDAHTEALLYAASRRIHLVNKVIPALQTQHIVLCDRFVDSSLVYQGFARGLGLDAILQLNSWVIDTWMPQLTIYFDVDVAIGLARVANRNEVNTRFDNETHAFHERIRAGYLQLVQLFPERIVKIDASLNIDDVVEQCMSLILTHLNKRTI